MPARLKLVVAYDGSAFAGWQSQSHQNTIQDSIERAFSRVIGRSVGVQGAGRTDAGVHALGQCAHVDLPNRRLSTARWPTALNALLPPTIRILRCRYVSQNFHARYSARGKIYRYRIWSGSILPPFEFKRAWHVRAPIDFALLRKSGDLFVGKHDFAAFAANRGKRPESTVRTINAVRVRRQGACLTVEFDGEGFLYKMARLMTGTMVACAARKFEMERIKQDLESRRSLGSRIAAPAQGLFLVKVRY